VVTVAVCLRCGAFKHGAFKPCPKCSYTPDDDESLTKHLLVTDHFLNRDQLESISAQVKAGESVEFPPEALQSARVSKEQLEAETKRLSRSCMVGCLVALWLVGAMFVIFTRLW
jgi:hypothetical protein